VSVGRRPPRRGRGRAAAAACSEPPAEPPVSPPSPVEFVSTPPPAGAPPHLSLPTPQPDAQAPPALLPPHAPTSRTHTHTHAKFNLTGRPGICVAMRVLLHPLLQLLQPNAQAPPVHSPPQAPTSHTQTQMPSLISLPGQYGARHLSGDVSTSSSFAAASAAQCSSSACVSAASRCCKQPYMMGTVTEYHALQGP